MKLWIDDCRAPPIHFKQNVLTGEKYEVYWAKTSLEALQYLEKYKNKITHISFDHDLGGPDTTIPVANWIEEQAYTGELNRFEWTVHSMNPVGRKALITILMQAEKYWSKDNAQST